MSARRVRDSRRGQTVTTGSLAGVVTDAQGGALPGATVIATHTPTGTVYEAVTDGEGRFNILNVRVGPYSVAVTMSGFKKDEQRNVAGRRSASSGRSTSSCRSRRSPKRSRSSA